MHVQGNHILWVCLILPVGSQPHIRSNSCYLSLAVHLAAPLKCCTNGSTQRLLLLCTHNRHVSWSEVSVLIRLAVAFRCLAVSYRVYVQWWWLNGRINISITCPLHTVHNVLSVAPPFLFTPSIPSPCISVVILTAKVLYAVTEAMMVESILLM